MKAEPAEAFRQVGSPIFTTTAVYSDWVITWCRQLLATTDALLKAEQGKYLDAIHKRRATLLVAMYACARYDARLALWVAAVGFLLFGASGWRLLPLWSIAGAVVGAVLGVQDGPEHPSAAGPNY